MDDSISSKYYYLFEKIVKKYIRSSRLLNKTQVNYFIDDENNDNLCNEGFNPNTCSLFDMGRGLFDGYDTLANCSEGCRK